MKKWKYQPDAALKWWKSLSIDDRVDCKSRFEIYRNRKDIIKKNFPNMYDLTNIRLSQLSDKHIIRIWVFRDRL